MDAKDALRQLALAQLIPAKAIIRESDGLTPMLCFMNEEGGGIAEIPQYGQPELKGAVMLSLRALLKQMEAVAYTFTMEAWVGTKRSTDDLDGYRPSKDPDREEAILVSAADVQGNKLVICCKIRRGETVTFAEPEFLDIMHGPLLELLDAAPTIN